MAISNSEEHSHWSLEQLQEFLAPVENVAYISNYFSYMKENINKRTAFLLDVYKESDITFSVRVNMLRANVLSVSQIPICPVCNKSHVKILKKEKKFAETCSLKCSRVIAMERTQETYQEKFGGHPLTNAAVQEKKKKTCIEKYGVDNATKTESTKAKMRQTNLERYGVENPAVLESVKEKAKQTVDQREGGRAALVAKTFNTIKERYGVSAPSKVTGYAEKVRKTSIEKYGVVHFAKSEEVGTNRKKAVREKYGVTPVMHVVDIVQAIKDSWAIKTDEELIEIVRKRKETTMRLYGCSTPVEAHHIKEKRKDRFSKKYGNSVLLKKLSNIDILDKKQNKPIRGSGGKITTQEQLIDAYIILNDKDQLTALYNTHGGLQASKILGVCDGTVYSYMRKHGIPLDPTIGSSFAERQIGDYLESLGINIIRNDRSVLQTKELDIYIPEHKLAIEFNGLFWHSTKFKEPSYHLNKMKECNTAGVRLIQIFEDEWNDRQEQIKNKLAAVLGKLNKPRVYARKTEIRSIGLEDYRAFYNDNHIQGCPRASISYGLFHENELVAAMSFSVNYGYMELVRYATSKQVVGGFSKLVNHFKKNHPEVKEIVSFADLRYSDGGMYFTNGFDLADVIRPNYFYVVDDKRIRKQKFRHKYLANILENYDPNLSEKENTENHDIWRIYDCGLLKFVLNCG